MYKCKVRLSASVLRIDWIELSWNSFDVLFFSQKRQAEEDKENAAEGAEVVDVEDIAGKQKDNLGKATTTVRGKKRQRSGKDGDR